MRRFLTVLLLLSYSILFRLLFLLASTTTIWGFYLFRFGQKRRKENIYYGKKLSLRLSSFFFFSVFWCFFSKVLIEDPLSFSFSVSPFLTLNFFFGASCCDNIYTLFFSFLFFFFFLFKIYGDPWVRVRYNISVAFFNWFNSLSFYSLPKEEHFFLE